MSRYTQYFGKNNVKSELAVGISSIATTIQVNENQGNLRGENFPVLGTLEHFDSTGKVSKREIVKVESRSGDSFTVVRKFAPCPPSDDATSQSAVSSSFDPGDSFSIYIPYEVFNAVSEAINDLYNNGNDRLFLKKTAGLGFEITPGNVRFETGEAYYPGGTGTVVDNSMNYVMLDSSFNIIVNQEELFDVQNISIAEVKAVNGEITEITTRKIDGIAGRMGGGGDPVYGDGSDGDLVISENTILNAGQQYNFSNLTICSGATVSFSGGGGAKIHVSGLFINEGTIDMTNLDVDNHTYRDSTSFCEIANCGFFNENAGKGGFSGYLNCPNTFSGSAFKDCCGIRVRMTGAGGNGGGLSSPDSCSGCGGTSCPHLGGYDGYQMGGGGAHAGDTYAGSCCGCNANGNNGGNGGNGYQTGGNTGNKYSGGGGGGGYYNGKGGDGGCGSGMYCASCSCVSDWTAFRNFSRCSRMGGDGGNGGIIGNGGNGGCGGQSFAGGNGGEGICGGNGGQGGAGGNCYIESSTCCCSCYNRFVGGNGGIGGAGFYGGNGGKGGDYFSIWGTTCDCFTSGTRLSGFGGKGGDGVVPGNGGNGGNYCRRECRRGIGGLTSTTYVCAGNGGQGGNGISALTSLNIKAKCFCNLGCILSVGSVGGRGGNGGCICGVSMIYNNMCSQTDYCIHAGNGGNGGKGGNGGEIQIITGNLLEKGCISVAGGVGGQGGTGGASMYGCSGTAGSNGSAGSSGTSGTLNFFILEG